MTRAESIAALLTRGYTEGGLEGLSDAVLEYMATDTPYWYNGKREIGPRSPWVPVPPTEEQRAVLVAEGRQIAQREGMRESTLAALANITRIGTGR